MGVECQKHVQYHKIENPVGREVNGNERKGKGREKEKRTANLLLLVVSVLDTGEENGGLVGEDEAILLKVGVSGVEDGVEHGLVEEEIAHPLGDDDVNLGERQLNLLHLALDQCDLVREAVGLDDLAGLEDDGRHVDADDVLCARLGSEPDGIRNHLQLVT
mgnify:CR=1 FL=1